MKKFLMIVAMMIGLAAVADQADLVLGYSSVGIDTYGDGVTPVLDGECYALVWAADGYDFAGFKYDGTVVDPKNNAIVSDDGFYYVCPFAKDGKCAVRLAFVVKKAFRDAHKNGTYRVVVLDTRVTANSLAGLNDDGTLGRVNSWGWANVKRTETVKAPAVRGARSVGLAPAELLGAMTDQSSQLPADSCDPVITNFSFNNDGDAVVEFKSTKSYYSYLLEMGATPVAVGEEKGDELVKGAEDVETVRKIVIPRSKLPKGQGFFRVGAKLDWSK